MKLRFVLNFFRGSLKLKAQEFVKTIKSTFWCQDLSDQTPAFTQSVISISIKNEKKSTRPILQVSVYMDNGQMI